MLWYGAMFTCKSAIERNSGFRAAAKIKYPKLLAFLISIYVQILSNSLLLSGISP